MKATWGMLRNGWAGAGEIRRNWRPLLKGLLVVVLKAFVLYQMAFLVAMTLCRVMQPEQAEYQLKPYFRVVNNRLTGYVVRNNLSESVCNQSSEFVLNTKFPVKEVCHLKNEPFPQPKNSHFNLVISNIDNRWSRVQVCWLRGNLTREVCEELQVKQGWATAHSINIKEVDFVQVSLELPNESEVFDQPTVSLVLDQHWLFLAFRRWYGTLSFLYSLMWALLASIVGGLIELARLRRHLPTLTKVA